MSYYYTKQGYAIVAGDSPSTHYFGGEPFHEAAVCPICWTPLLLLAEIDCRVLRKMERQKLFLELDRLPFYYCWKCCAEKLSYQISGASIKVFGNKGTPQGDDFPYAGFPNRFDRRPVKLVPIPYETAKLLALVQDADNSLLNEKDLSAIQESLQDLRHAHFAKSSFTRHQIGGLLNLAQGHEYIVCPNPDCKHHQLAKSGCGTRMQELAVFHNDPHSGLPMTERLEDLSAPGDFDEFIQVVYWICEECLTIAASNRCD